MLSCCRVPAVLALLMAFPAPAYAFKCMASLQKDPIVIVDDQFHTMDAIRGMHEREEIHSVEIVCWNPSDSTFSSPGYGVVLIVTVAAMERVTTALEAVSRAQAAFYDRHGRFAGSAEELAVMVDGDMPDVEIGLEPDGWRASMHPAVPLKRCNAYGTPENRASRLEDRGYPTCVPVESARFAIPDEVIEASKIRSTTGM